MAAFALGAVPASLASTATVILASSTMAGLLGGVIAVHGACARFAQELQRIRAIGVGPVLLAFGNLTQGRKHAFVGRKRGRRRNPVALYTHTDLFAWL